MRIDVHRPLTLRLLSDASEDGGSKESDEALAKVLAGIGTWTTRMWLAERPMAGMNKAAAEFAHGPGPGAGEDCVDYWLGRLQRLRNTRVGCRETRRSAREFAPGRPTEGARPDRRLRSSAN